jgi:glycosyltransferase involved in cell wall biosynthesis
MYGTQQNEGYLEQCRAMAAQIANAEIRFDGEINPQEVAEALQSAHFFYMTTLGENYGHAIIEALVHSTPVIISDRTPWRNLAQTNAGWDVPLESIAVVPILQKCLEMDDAEYQRMTADAFSYGKANAEDPSVLRQAYAVFA